MSSILEISERQLVDSTSVDGTPVSSSVPHTTHSLLNAPATDLARPGFFSVLDVAVEYDVPYISIEQIGLLNSFEKQGIHYGYSVGTGYSARVIRHFTEYDVGPTKKGTIVALKQYLPKGSSFGQGKGETENTVFQAVRREIKALCHPRLRKHENVCNILYVGWHGKSIYPSLALELAAYGTLEDVMTAPGIGLSSLQKMNITIDVISAILAVHSSSMIHGDIKPGNIILQHHETRQVVAKIIDLAGSRDLYDDSDLDFRPGMGTELWAPPEVCLGSPDVDWYKADTYSLGLLVASLWARPPTWVQSKCDSCILSRFVPRNMSQEDKRNRLIILKTHTDLNIQGVMQQCWSRISCINPILLTTLSADPRWRLDGIKLGSLMLPVLCWRIPRTDPRLDVISEAPRSSPVAFTVLSPNYINSTRDFHDMVFTRLRAESAPARKLLSTISPGFVTSLESQVPTAEDIVERSYICLKSLESSVKKQCGPKAASSGLLAYEYALCHYLGLGTPHDLAAIIENVNAAALSGYYNELHLALVAKGQKPSLATDKLRPLFLVLGMVIGMKVSIGSLKHEFPDQYQSVLHALSLRRDIGRHRKASSRSDLVEWLKGAAECPRSDPQVFTLRECCETHNAQRVRELLASDTFVASIVDEGLGIFHLLTYLEDSEAASLVDLCFERGADLSHRATGNSWTCLKITETPPSQTALAWAWAYGMDKYFDELLRLHKREGIPITDYHILLWCSAEHFDYKTLQKLLKLFDTDPHLLQQCSDWLPLESNFSISQETDVGFRQMAIHRYIQTCAGACLSDRPTGYKLDKHLLSRIERNGLSLTEARLQTLITFLDAGVDVASYLGLCLYSDDSASCDLLCATLKKKPSTHLTTLSKYLSKLLHASIHGHDVNGSRAHSIEGAPRSFDVILSHFPYLAAQSIAEPPCYIPLLCTAAIVRNAFFTRRLLDLGADLDVEYDNNSALALALTHGNLETAELTYGHMTDEQRRRTFDGHPVTGFTMTGRIVGAWVRKRNPALEDALIWLKKVGGVRPLANEKSKVPCWEVILTRRPSPLQEHTFRDTEILGMLFKWFPDQITAYTSRGFMPIHWAASLGLASVMKVLVSLGADINAEVPDVEGASYPGRTALNIAILLKLDLEKNVPKDIADGGASEVQRWRQRCHDTLEYLNSMDARSGTCAIEAEQYLAIFDQATHESSGRLQVRVPESSEDAGRGTTHEELAWPAILKPDRTSLSAEDVLYTKEWMQVYCQNTRRLMLVKRDLVFFYLHGDFGQPRAGQVSCPPQAYSLWLDKMAAVRKRHWIQSNLPSDIGFPLPSPPLFLDEVKEWHLHGWSPKGSSKLIERLPRYRLIFFLGRPLQPDSERDKETFDMLEALHDNCLDEDDLTGPDAIIVDNDVIGTSRMEDAYLELKRLKKSPGKGLRFLLLPTGKDGEIDGHRKLIKSLGEDKKAQAAEEWK